MKRELTCIVCPIGCPLTVSDEDGEIKVTGNTCPRGAVYGKNEVANPTRTLTTTVRVGNREKTVLAVKSDRPIPKGMLFDAMREINVRQVDAPVRIGDPVIENLFGICNIIATANVD